jgi:hypothetical protein
MTKTTLLLFMLFLNRAGLWLTPEEVNNTSFKTALCILMMNFSETHNSLITPKKTYSLITLPPNEISRIKMLNKDLM